MKKQVYISYNHKDIEVANLIRHELLVRGLEPWIDVEKIRPGERIADKIKDGLSASDYYLILISENSNASKWVRQELSFAFELSEQKKLSIVPILLANVDVPFELHGLLFIDFRTSVQRGLTELSNFFKSQFTKISTIDKRTVTRKSDQDRAIAHVACIEYLGNLELRELRYVLSERLAREQLEVIWFDLFGRRLVDEIRVENVSMCCVELLDRARREKLLPYLLSILCRNHPHVTRE